MTLTPQHPFDGSEIEEISLANSPLVTVIGQLRIPPLASLSGKGFNDFALEFTDQLKVDYPLLDHEPVINFPNPSGSQEVTQIHLWRLRSGDRNWTLTLGPTFLSIEVQRYTDRHEFITRFARALNIYVKLSNAPYLERLGVRYVNRIEDQVHLQNLGNLLKDQMLGGVAVPRFEGVTLAQMFSDAVFKIDHRFLQARWGMLPPGINHDPSLQPAKDVSWILDLDAYTGELPKTANLDDELSKLAKTSYSFFRWSIKDEFISAFGGAVNE